MPVLHIIAPRGLVRALLAALLALAAPGCLVQGRCASDADCPSPKVCGSQGTCVYACTLSDDCGPGFTCVDHRCQAEGPRPITCPDEMQAVAGLFCMDRYEASRPGATAVDDGEGDDEGPATSREGVLPWMVGDDNALAAAACEAAGKRLCTPREWQSACEGQAATVYAYGNTYDPETCNGLDTFPEGTHHPTPTGAFPGCIGEWGIYDLNGNVWEHVAEGDGRAVRGGAYNCIDSMTLHRCDYVPRSWVPSALGFRCCLTPEGVPEVGPEPVVEVAEVAEPLDVADAESEGGGCLDPDTGGDTTPDPGGVEPTDVAPDPGDVEPTDLPPDPGDVPPDPGDAEPTDLPLDLPAEADTAPEPCPPDMVVITPPGGGAGWCLDRYEASRPDATATSFGADGSQATSRAGVLPWFPVDVPLARAACEAAGKRLCTSAEIQTACMGSAGTVYLYGDAYVADTCNGIDAFCDCTHPNCASLEQCPFPHCRVQGPGGEAGMGCGAYFHVTPTGAFPACVNEWGAYDVNGNVWELVDTGTEESWFKGGAYNCGDSEWLHRCDMVFQGISAKGFRCCRALAGEAP